MADRDFGCGCATEEGNACFSEEDGGSCSSHFYSVADGDCGCSSEERDLESGGLFSDPVAAKMVEMQKIERICRICHLSLVTCSPGSGSGVAIELGCSCKDDLGSAHKQCAETWFKIKGNKTCEICNAVARNVVVCEESGQQPAAAPHTLFAPTAATALETQSFVRRFLNFLLGFMIFFLVISWLFRFNISEKMMGSL